MAKGAFSYATLRRLMFIGIAVPLAFVAIYTYWLLARPAALRLWRAGCAG